MNVFVINAFTSEQDATDFFNNAVVESDAVSGVKLGAKGGIGFIKDDGDLSELGGGGQLFCVLTYPKSVTVEIDGNGANEDPPQSEAGGPQAGGGEE